MNSGDSMNKKEFKEFCKNECIKRGFKKIKNAYYLAGDDLVCGIDLQKSNYGNVYYVNFFFCIGDYKSTSDYPSYYESDIKGRIIVMSKNETIKGRCFLTALIEYEEYTDEELRVYFDEEFDNKIMPPIIKGKKYILNNLNILYHLTLNQDEVKRKLQG